MIREEQMIFFTGVPGSAWSRVATLLAYSPKLNLNNSDRCPEREYFIKTSKSWSTLINHQGGYYGSGMEFGKGFDNPSKHYTKESFVEELMRPFKTINDQNYLFKSHSFAYCLDWLVETFPKAKHILVVRDHEKSLKWWYEAGGFDITYPSYKWYEGRMDKQLADEDHKIREFLNAKDVLTYAPTKPFFSNKLAIDFSDKEAYNHMLAIQSLGPDGVGRPLFDSCVGLYNFENL